MKKAHLILILIISSVRFLTGQSLIPDDVLEIKAGIEDQVQKSTFDDNGNIYLAGIFKNNSLIIGNYILNNKGDNDIFLIKLNSEMQLVFAKSYRNSNFAKVTDLNVDKDEIVYLTGLFNDSIEFDNNTLISPFGELSFRNSTFLAKVSIEGDILWTKSYDGDSWSSSIIVDSNNNIYLSCSFYINIEFSNLQKTLQHDESKRNFFLKLNSNGIEIWVKQFGGKLLIDNAQNIYMLGSYSDSIYFGDIVLKTISDRENHNIYVAKSDTNGHVFWAKKFCDNEHALLTNVLIDKSAGTILMSGTYKTDSLTFDDIKIGNNGAADIFIAKIDTSAHVLMAKTFGGERADYAWGLSKINKLYTAIVGSCNSDSIILGDYVIYKDTSDYSRSFFIFIIDSYGNPVWAKSFPKSSGQVLRTIISDGIQNTYVIGDFNTNSSSKKSASIFDKPTYIEQPSIYLIKFKEEGGNEVITKISPTTSSNIFNVFPNPVSSILNISTDNKTINFDIKIFNIEGKMILQKSLTKANNLINVESLSKGIYFLQMKTTEEIFVEKVIKK